MPHSEQTKAKLLPHTRDPSPTGKKDKSDQTRVLSLAHVKLISFAFVLFLGISWILAQTTSLGDQIGHYLPGFVEEKMSGKRTVGYFVSTSHECGGMEANAAQVNW